jgi:predicted exporter
VSGELGRTAVFLVGHAQPQIARDAARRLGKLMNISPVFSTVQWDYSNQPKAFHAFYFPLRYRFISQNLRSHLDEGDNYQYFIDRLKKELYQPMASFTIQFLEDDPLLFFPELMKDFWKNFMKMNHARGVEIATGKLEKKIEIEEGMLRALYNGRYYYCIIAQLSTNPFEENIQTQLDESWQTWSNELRHTFPELELTYTAVARFASAIRHQMQKDMSFISIGSTIGIAVLVFLTFRSVKQLFIAVMPLLLGLWNALGLSLLIFGELHAFTLVFGASLVGVCIDYSLFYFAHHRLAREWESRKTMRNILPALGLGALTTIMSYIGLGLTPLVGLRQIAVFASCGILISFFSVVFLFPFILQKPHPIALQAPLLYQGSKYYLTLWDRHQKPMIILLIITLVVCIKGLLVLHVSDSPLVLKTLPMEVTEQDRLVREVMGISEAQQYLVIDGKTPEETLQRLEKFDDFMHTNPGYYGAEFGPVLTAFLPSRKRQQDNVQSIKRLLEHEPAIANALESLGLSERSIHNFFRDLEREPGTFLLPDQWLRHDISIGLRNFWLGHTTEGTSIVVSLYNVTDIPRMKANIAAFEGLHYFDHIEDFTHILEHYRRNVIVLVTTAYIAILALLIWRYRLRGFVVMLPPCLAACITVGILGLLGYTFHLLHWLSLLLILGMGVDYAIFLVEGEPISEPTTLLALTLAAVTTIMSFGLLSFSSQAALKAIGLTVFLGIVCAWLLAPLARYGRSPS